MVSRPLRRWALPFLALAIVVSAACGSQEKQAPPQDPPPAVPRALRTDINANVDGVIKLIWDTVSDTDLAGSRVYRALGKDGPFKVVLAETKTTGHDDRGVEHERSYFYRVTAYDLAGNESAQSDSVEARCRNYSPPAPPTGQDATGQNLQGKPKIVVSWSPNKEADLAGYHVFRAKQDAPIPVNTDKHRVTKELIAPGTSRYEDLDVEEGVIYYYTVAAVDRDGLVSPNPPGLRVSDAALKRVKLLAPANSDTGADPYPTFKWEKSPSAVGYVVSIQTTSFGGRVVWRSKFIRGAQSVSYDGATPLESTRTYYWFVFAFSKEPDDSSSADGNSASDVWSFQVK